MNHTKADLVKSVMLKLGVLDPNEAPEAEPDVRVRETAQSVLEDLYDQGLIPFDMDANELPGIFLVPLSFLVAQPLASEYGVTDERMQRIEIGADRGLRTLRRYKAKPYYGTPATATYY